ncbi:MAG: endolytic transglycosylase MltG [Bacteroidetes bacterium]|uniref:Endolytic murein transglycosylase n=1 Tax=Candidatus Cryptobacteroides faecipullorum TaxID=2840764 RepID=A0A9D9I902_9BACT|nr:endolytic transglycosylase MltG [Candidatus Cryptobacteroides faecipullorum]
MGADRKKYTILTVAVCLAVVSGVLAFIVCRYWNDNRRPCFSKDYILYVYPDTGVSEAIDSLVSGAGALRRGSLERASGKEHLDTAIKPGRYVIEPSFTAIYVARMLSRGWQTPQNMILSGTIRNKGRLAEKIGRQMMVDSSQVARALNDSSFLAGYGFTPETVFAMILPDTYQMYWTSSVKDIFDRLKKEYDVFWTQERRSAAQAQGLTPYEVSVMASIVSGETLKESEYPVIAGVYLNRLHKGMKLQADPTIAFCYDYTLDRILKKHLKVDSPYNTYKYKGLPPAPINVPPKACIEAVLHPDEHGYIYFCASPEFNGTHRFAVTYGEHLKNARAFQRALTQRQKEKAAASR